MKQQAATPVITDFHGRRVTVMGLGAFGGGIGAVRFLTARGAQVTVTDLKPASELAASLAEIAAGPEVRLHLGEHRDDDFTEADLIVVSPAVPRDNRYLQLAADAGVPLTSEMNLFWERNKGQTVCITGSNGKSTTTALVYALLSATTGSPGNDQAGPGAGDRAGRVWLGGNIGKSLLPEVDQIQPTDRVVLELSSFQLEDLAPLQPCPQVAVVTNFTPNHLDRHGTVEAYRAAKQNLLCWQSAGQCAVLNQHDADVRSWPTSARKFWFGRGDRGLPGVFAVPAGEGRSRVMFRHRETTQEWPLLERLRLAGEHNVQNALAACCAAMLMAVPPQEMAVPLGEFGGLPHRLQLVGEPAGRRLYNDSKATTPEATLLALQAFTVPVVLLAGGYDKGLDLSALAREIVARQVKAVALLGQTGARLQGQLHEADPDRRTRSHVHASLAEAFAWAMAESAPGDVVLLSPGCASYDWFRNYEERGDEFTRLARNWRGE